MKCIARSSVACLPVTALDTVTYHDKTILLSGSGSTLTLHTASSPPHILARKRLFTCQNIHGITSRTIQHPDGVLEIRIVAWGGKLMCCATFSFPNSALHDANQFVQLHVRSLINLGDRILNISFDATNAGVLLLTAHNVVHRVEECFEAASWSAKVQHIGDGPQTLLYSGQIVAARYNHLIVASGTVFGEVIVWTCSLHDGNDDWTIQTRHSLLGHQGSIFGVVISTLTASNRSFRRLLASCSDDRTVRIWDISDCDTQREDDEKENSASNDTGFGSKRSDVSHITMAWGHQSRIWNVSFMQASEDLDHQNFSLVSSGEDGVCQQWKLKVENHNPDSMFADSEICLQQSHYDRYHAGKNAWSLICARIQGQLQVLTGGADGQVVMRHHYQDAQTALPHETSMKFEQILKPLHNSDHTNLNKSKIQSRALKQYLLLGDNGMLATTDVGEVLYAKNLGCDSWTVLGYSVGKSSAILCSNLGGNLGFFSCSNQGLFCFNVMDETVKHLDMSFPAQPSWMHVVCSTFTECHTSTVYLLVNVLGDRTRLVKIEQSQHTLSAQVYVLEPPPDFVVTSGLYITELDLLICGSRAGALALFQYATGDTIATKYTSCIRHVHGCDSVTSIIQLPKDAQLPSKNAVHIITTGRDGTYSGHEIIDTSISPIGNLRTIHRSSLPIGPCIEGAYLKVRKNEASSLVLHGFQSKNFVVWDETLQTQLMSIDCGGAHRSWNYLPLLADASIGIFTWTKAGTFNKFKKTSIDHSIIQRGGHGREIKALAVLQTNNNAGPAADATDKMIATGAEDTDIRLFQYTPSLDVAIQSTSLRNIAVLRGHTTGLQHLMFSNCGRFLFSSAGYEEFFVWRLQHIPLLGIGSILAGKLSKTAEDSDARIMSFDVMKIVDDGARDASFIIAMAYSNGKAKCFKFSYDISSDAGSFDLLHQIDVGAVCLTQAALHKDNVSDRIVIGATDGSIRSIDIAGSEAVITSHRVHQSNIAALAVSEMFQSRLLIVTGGDDNALGMTIMQSGINFATPHMQTTLVPNAHAAAVTAVAVCHSNQADDFDSLLVVSVGNDQKAKLWRLRIEHSRVTPIAPEEMPLKTQLKLELVHEYWTDVADVSSIEVIYRESSENHGDKAKVLFEVVIVGVGMQVIGFEYEE